MNNSPAVVAQVAAGLAEEAYCVMLVKIALSNRYFSMCSLVTMFLFAIVSS